MKKYVAVLLALAMIVGSMAGCTGGSNSSTQDSSKADSSKSAEVSQDAEAARKRQIIRGNYWIRLKIQTGLCRFRGPTM